MIRSVRSALSVLVAVAAFMLLAALCSTAFAATGDSEINAQDLSVYYGSSLTTNLAGGSAAGSNTSYYLKVELNAGDTLVATITPGPHVVNLKAFVMIGSVTEGMLLPSGQTLLTYVAPAHDMYQIYIATSGRDDGSPTTITPPGAFTIEPTLRPYTPPAETLDRLSGLNRYATAVAVSKRAFPNWSGVKNLVLASGDNNHQPDALTGAGLAGAYNCPLMLVPTNYLDADTKAAISAMPSGLSVHIVGGTPAVSAGAMNLIKKISRVKSVERISGTDRYATGVAVAAKMKVVLGSKLPHTALLTNGSESALLLDPLVASTVSYRQHFPVLLLKPTVAPWQTTKALGDYSLSSRYVLGDTAAVSESIRASIGATRITGPAGTSVQGDATAFAEKARQMGWLGSSTIGVAAAVPDAATGGAFMGKMNGPLLLVTPTSVPTVTSDYLTANKASIAGGYLFGGPPAVTDGVLAALEVFIN